MVNHVNDNDVEFFDSNCIVDYGDNRREKFIIFYIFLEDYYSSIHKQPLLSTNAGTYVSVPYPVSIQNESIIYFLK